MAARFGLWRRLSAEELMLLNCGVGEDSWGTARRANPSILKEISPEYSLEGLILKLKLQYFGHLMWRMDSFEKTLMLGKIESRRRGWQRMRWLDSLTNSRRTWVSASSGRWWRTGKPGMLHSMGSQRIGYDWVTEQEQGHDKWPSKRKQMGMNWRRRIRHHGISFRSLQHFSLYKKVLT